MSHHQPRIYTPLVREVVCDLQKHRPHWTLGCCGPPHTAGLMGVHCPYRQTAAEDWSFPIITMTRNRPFGVLHSNLGLSTARWELIPSCEHTSRVVTVLRPSVATLQRKAQPHTSTLSWQAHSSFAGDCLAGKNDARSDQEDPSSLDMAMSRTRACTEVRSSASQRAALPPLRVPQDGHGRRSR